MGLDKTENNICYIPFEIIFGTTYYAGADHLLSIMNNIDQITEEIKNL